jgi:hypothetical protein
MESFVSGGDRCSSAASAKAAISSSRAFSNAWPSFRFASAEIPPADCRSLGRAGGKLADAGAAGTLTTKGHSIRYSDIPK